MAAHYLEFERPIADLEAKIEELSKLSETSTAGQFDAEIEALRARAQEMRRDAYANLGAWQKVQVARHPDRPHFVDYAAALIDEFVELRGDRKFADDQAIMGGLGRFRGRPVVVIGNEKGRDTVGRVRHNFGYARPEGYRKAIRLMELAERFNLPVISFVDTTAAYPGIASEERGVAEAIARATEKALLLGVPMVAIVTGEGGSGGALGIGVCDRLLMLQYSTYSVISPEGCASILWKSQDKKEVAAEALNLTADRLLKLGLVDEVIEEPLGGAHRNAAAMAASLKAALVRHLDELDAVPRDQLRQARAEKIAGFGVFAENDAA
jgi:acetyl-CoA carboxylase carboxyl transferase subunit alpha